MLRRKRDTQSHVFLSRALFLTRHAAAASFSRSFLADAEGPRRDDRGQAPHFGLWHLRWKVPVG